MAGRARSGLPTGGAIVPLTTEAAAAAVDWAAGRPAPLGSTAPGTFRVSSTGWSGPSGTTLANCTPANHCIARTLVAQFKPPSFLNYVYYTDYETLDPAALYDPNNNPPEPTDCAAHYPNRGGDCSSIYFVGRDVINGPLHSEDTLAICSSTGSAPNGSYRR